MIWVNIINNFYFYSFIWILKLNRITFFKVLNKNLEITFDRLFNSYELKISTIKINKRKVTLIHQEKTLIDIDKK